MSKKNFLMQPYESCRPIVSIGQPGAGKSYTMLKCVEFWHEMDTFAEYNFVLPAYNIEQNNSYEYLNEVQNCNIFNFYHSKIASSIMEKQEKLIKKLKKENKDREKFLPRIFLCVDDSTFQRSSLMKDLSLVQLVTMSRHYNVHVWLLMHVGKNVIPPSVRNQMMYVFVYDIKPQQIKIIYDEYVSNPDFKNFKEFEDYWFDKIEPLEYKCLLLDTLHKQYSPHVNHWFSSE